MTKKIINSDSMLRAVSMLHKLGSLEKSELMQLANIDQPVLSALIRNGYATMKSEYDATIYSVTNAGRQKHGYKTDRAGLTSGRIRISEANYDTLRDNPSAPTRPGSDAAAKLPSIGQAC